MIELPVDEAFAFDYLSILQVKVEKLGKGRKEFHDCSNHLRNSIGEKLFTSIIYSTEYISLVAANSHTFNAVEKARYGEITAKEVDDCNMERYNSKVALQKRFFPDSELVEKKS